MKKNQNSTHVVDKVQKQFKIIGRAKEISQLASVIMAERNILIEGPVGVGKTVLASAVAQVLGKKMIRVDGDSRFTEQKLTGWFDPALVIKKGFNAKTFCDGPLVAAMKSGSILFINELNRMPEAVQNVLLPAIDEGILNIPQLGTIKAKPGFLIVATQNPREFVATSHLSEALMDRMEWIQLDYQSFDEEVEIALAEAVVSNEAFAKMAVALVRLTRNHSKIKRGASVRAAIAILKILQAKEKTEKILTEKDFWEAVKLALPTRIELLSQEFDGTFDQQIDLLLREFEEELKKNSPAKSLSLSH